LLNPRDISAETENIDGFHDVLEGRTADLQQRQAAGLVLRTVAAVDTIRLLNVKVCDELLTLGRAIATATVAARGEVRWEGHQMV
jgi:hypothetical protein